MPFITAGGSGGGGLHFRVPVDRFTGATLTACRTARNTAFSSSGTLASVLAQYQGDQSLAIILAPTGADLAFETYLPGNTGNAYDATQWVVRSDAIQGNDGNQARSYIIIHTNSVGQPTPATPVGGTFNYDTEEVVPPTGATEDPTPPGTNEDVWASQAEVTPSQQSGIVTPVWSEWVERSHLSAGISHVEHDTTMTGTGLSSDPLGAVFATIDLGSSPTQLGDTFTYAAPTGYTAGSFPIAGVIVQFGLETVSNPDESAVIITIGSDEYTLVSAGGREVKLHELIDDSQYIALGKGDTLLLLGPEEVEIVDISNTSLPPADEDATGKIFIDRFAPGAWMIHETQQFASPPLGNFNRYVNSDYLGPYGDDNRGLSGSADVGRFYWNWNDHAFRIWTRFTHADPLSPPDTTFTYDFQTVHNPAFVLGGDDGIYLGHTDTQQGLLSRLPATLVSSGRYIGVTLNQGGLRNIYVEELDNSTYVAAVLPLSNYDFVTVGIYGHGTSGGQTAQQVQAIVDDAIDDLIDGAPADRNTLNELSDAIDAEANVQSDWDEADDTVDSYIQNKPTLASIDAEENVQANWDELDPTEDAYIRNKPTNVGGGEDNVQVDWDEADTSSDAFIQNKPAIPEDSSFHIASNVTVSGNVLTIGELTPDLPASATTFPPGHAIVIRIPVGYVATAGTVSIRVPPSNVSGNIVDMMNASVDPDFIESGGSYIILTTASAFRLASGVISETVLAELLEDVVVGLGGIAVGRSGNAIRLSLTTGVVHLVNATIDDSEGVLDFDLASLNNEDIVVFYTPVTGSLPDTSTDTQSAISISSDINDLHGLANPDGVGISLSNLENGHYYISVYDDSLNRFDLLVPLFMQVDWDETDTSSDAYIQNKPDLEDAINTDLIREYNVAETSTGTNTGSQNEFAGSIFEVGSEAIHVRRAGGRVNNASGRSGYRVVLFSAQEISGTDYRLQDSSHADYFYHRSSSIFVSSGNQYVEAGFDQIIPANSFFGVALIHSSGVRPSFGDTTDISTVPGSAAFSWVSAALSEESSESALAGDNLQPSLVGAYTTRVEFSTDAAIKFSDSFTYNASDGIYEVDVSVASAITAQDEGVALTGDVSTINVVGPSAVATVLGGVLTITITGGTPTPTDHTRVAVVSPDNDFSTAEINAGTTSDTTAITLPIWTTGTRYLEFLQPSTETEYTDIRPQGSPLNVRSSFDIQIDAVTYNGSDHRVYLYDDTLLQRSSGEVWVLS